MLRSGIDKDNQLTSHGFLIAVEVAADVSIDHLQNKLSDALQWVEGVGKIEVEHLGELDTYSEVGENVTEA